MPENNQMMSVEGQLVGMPLAGPESFSQQQLEYLKRALGVDETVLFDGTATATPTLSESPTNFERIRILYGSANNSTVGNNIGLQTIDVPVSFINGYSNGSLFITYCFSGDVSAKQPQIACAYYTGVKTTSWSCTWGLYGRVYSGTKTESTDWIRIHQIVGIHRIAGGNT